MRRLRSLLSPTATLPTQVGPNFVGKTKSQSVLCAPTGEIHSCLDELSAVYLFAGGPRFPRLLVGRARSHGHKATSVPLRLARDCKPVTCIPTPDGGNSTNQFALEPRSYLYQRACHRTASSSCSIPTTTASPTRLAVLDAVAEFAPLPISTSGSAVSCRPAIARICTGPSTRMSGTCIHDGIQDGYPLCISGPR